MNLLPAALAAAVLALGVAAAPAESAEPSLPMLLDPGQMQRAKTALRKGDPRFAAAYESLIEEAEAALGKGPFSVTDKTGRAPSGDPHDYISIGIYWWPNPDTEDGLPYVSRDGERNPESRDDTFDAARTVAMDGAVRTLSLAYFYSDDERYAEKAAELLRVWFLAPETRMNPHLKYAQAIPGRVDGRGTGIISTAEWIGLVDLVPLLRDSAHWSDRDHAALQEWFRRYAAWLKDSDNGRQVQNARGNIAVWYDAQVIAYALFTGNESLAREQARRWTLARIGKHIEPDGSQPHELRRTRSFSYSQYQLDAFATAARLAERVDVDLWHHEPESGGSIRAAIDFLLPYVDPRKIESWPYEQITPVNPDSFARTVLIKAIPAYPESSSYREAYRRVLRSEGETFDGILHLPGFLFVTEEQGNRAAASPGPGEVATAPSVSPRPRTSRPRRNGF